MTIAGIEYPEKDLDFTNILCDMEDMGFDVMGMLSNQAELTKHAFSFSRAVISIFTGEKDLSECGRLLTKHIAMGGTLDDIITAFSDQMVKAGFGRAGAAPQDHKKKGAAKKTEEQG